MCIYSKSRVWSLCLQKCNETSGEVGEVRQMSARWSSVRVESAMLERSKLYSLYVYCVVKHYLISFSDNLMAYTYKRPNDLFVSEHIR